MSQRGISEFTVKAYIHGRFKIQDGSTFADKMAFHYIHMNNKERRAKEAVYEKAKFKFKKDHLQVRKPNRMTHVQEIKYPYPQIEKVFLFNEYPTIIAFCINKKTHWVALLYETAVKEDALKACRAVEAYHRDKMGPNAGTKIGRGIGLTRPESYIDPSDVDSQYYGTMPPTILYNGKPEDSDSDSDFPDDIDSPKLRMPAAISRTSNGRPVSYTEGVGPGVGPGGVGTDGLGPGTSPKMLLNVWYDHAPRQALSAQNGHRRSKSPHRHDKKDEDNFKVRVLGRYSSANQEAFSPNRAHYHLRNCMSNPPEATNPGDLRLMSDCMKLGALKNGHYDHQQVYRLMAFEDDPNTLIFGIVEKNKPMYMLLRFESTGERDRAVEHIKQRMGPGRIPDSGDHHLSGLVQGNSYSKRTTYSGTTSLEQMSRTIALPSEREMVVAAQQRRSSSGSSRSSMNNGYDEVIVSTRRVGVHAERRRSPTPPGHMTVDEEFKLLLASTRIEAEKNNHYIDAVVVEDHHVDRSHNSTLYFGEEEQDEDQIEAEYSTRSHAMMGTKTSSSQGSYNGSYRGEKWKWVEEDTYIDYQPGVGMVESDCGPIYMYCARQVRENDYRLF